jgi:hypothetical protein
MGIASAPSSQSSVLSDAVTKFLLALQQGDFVGPTCRESAATLFTTDAVIDYRGPIDANVFKIYPAGLDGVCEYFTKASSYGFYDLKAHKYTKGDRIVQIMDYIPGFAGANAKQASGRVQQYNVFYFNIAQGKIAGFEALFDKPALFDELKYGRKRTPLRTPQMDVVVGLFEAYQKNKFKKGKCISNVGKFFTKDAVVDARVDKADDFFKLYPAGLHGVCEYYIQCYGTIVHNLTASMYARGDDVVMILKFIPELDPFHFVVGKKQTKPMLAHSLISFNEDKSKAVKMDIFYSDPGMWQQKKHDNGDASPNWKNLAPQPVQPLSWPPQPAQPMMQPAPMAPGNQYIQPMQSQTPVMPAQPFVGQAPNQFSTGYAAPAHPALAPPAVASQQSAQHYTGYTAPVSGGFSAVSYPMQQLQTSPPQPQVIPNSLSMPQPAPPLSQAMPRPLSVPQPQSVSQPAQLSQMAQPQPQFMPLAQDVPQPVQAAQVAPSESQVIGQAPLMPQNQPAFQSTQLAQMAPQDLPGANYHLSALAVNESLKSRSQYSLETFNCGRFAGSHLARGSYEDWSMGLSYTFTHRMNMGCLTLPSPLSNPVIELNMVVLPGCSMTLFESPLCSRTAYRALVANRKALWIKSADAESLGLPLSGKISSVQCSCP